MRKVGSQFALVGLTIVCALAVGYAIAALTGNNSRQLSPLGEIAAPDETAVAQSPAVDQVAPGASAAALALEESPFASVEPSPPPMVSAPATSSSAAEVFIDESFNTTSPSFPPKQEATWSAAYVDGQYRLTLNGQTNIGLVGVLPAINYQLDVDVRVNEGGAGIVFLGAAPSTSYRLVIAPDGAYSIERQDGTTVEKVVDWTASQSLTADAGALNRLRVERRGSTVEFFANDKPLATFEVPAGDFTNRYGFVLTSRSGEGSASFDNLRGEKLP